MAEVDVDASPSTGASPTVTQTGDRAGLPTVGNSGASTVRARAQQMLSSRVRFPQAEEKPNRISNAELDFKSDVTRCSKHSYKHSMTTP